MLLCQYFWFCCVSFILLQSTSSNNMSLKHGRLLKNDKRWCYYRHHFCKFFTFLNPDHYFRLPNIHAQSFCLQCSTPVLSASTFPFKPSSDSLSNTKLSTYNNFWASWWHHLGEVSSTKINNRWMITEPQCNPTRTTK